jgi:predicted NUDIX family NTP pyrophosphohydrolase
MMAKKSAGLLMFRRSTDGQVQVLLVHPGGPFWANKDLGAWTVPKGEYDDSEDALEAAKREFAEETGFAVSGPFLPLGSLKQPSGKTVSVWAFESDCDPAALVSNKFEMEWPPKSGRMASFVEIDRAGWFSVGEARERLVKGQVGFVEALEKAVPRDSRLSEGRK